jgi:hypothetical protein
VAPRRVAGESALAGAPKGAELARGRRWDARRGGGAGAVQPTAQEPSRRSAPEMAGTAQEVGDAPATVKEPRGGWAEVRSVVRSTATLRRRRQGSRPATRVAGGPSGVRG